MTITIHLLGHPRVERSCGSTYQVRSRKSWALLTYLVLTERAPARSQLASLLYPEADDPLRALRWNLAEVRRALGDEVALHSDPVRLELPVDAVVDVHVLLRGRSAQAVGLPGLGAGLLEGFSVRDAPAFELWLVAAQRHVAAAAEAVLHEAALDAAACDRVGDAIALAARALALRPLDENHHALLIRLYRRAGDIAGARRQHAACVELLARELGIAPGAAVAAALEGPVAPPAGETDVPAVEAIVEAGRAAIAAGAVRPGVGSLRTAVQLADRTGAATLRTTTRIALAEAVIHSLGGPHGEGVATLHEADRIATAAGDDLTLASVRAELGYVDFLRGRYDRAERWFDDALALAGDDGTIRLKALAYLGSVASDRADYPRALDLLGRAIEEARASRVPRREAYTRAMVGRVHLLRRDLDLAAGALDDAIAVAQDRAWLAFLPWPQALRSEVHLLAGDLAAAEAIAEEAFTRACQLGDPCWEGTAARARALVAEACGRTDDAVAGLLDARARCTRVADGYAWLEAYILDSLAAVGTRADHPRTDEWILALTEMAGRHGMRELTVRALRHAAGRGNAAAAEAAEVLAADLVADLALAGSR